MLAKATLFIPIIGLLYPTLASSYCSDDFAGDADYPYQYYQTKTLYDNSDRGDITSHQNTPGCEPVAIVMLFRHGARYSGDDETDKFQLLEEIRAKINSTRNAEMCSHDLEKITRWENWYDPLQDKDLATTGIKEMTELGQRFSEAFPEIFASSKDYKFVSSDTQRTRESAKVFMQNAFEESVPISIDDHLIRAYDYCDRFMHEVADNNTVTAEEKKFAEGDVITSIASQVAMRLGIPDADINNDVVDTIRKEGCAEEEWSLGNNSVWCLAFTKEDLQAFEYQEDLEDYVTKSYGVEISYESSCLMKEYILAALNSISQGAHTSQFLFGHSQTLMSTLTVMKLIEDDGPFLSDDYPSQLNRKFRGSIYTPASGNIAFVVYQCNGEKKLQVFHNEKLLRLPLENPIEGDLWGLDQALEYYKSSTSECRWTERCSLNPEPTPAITEETTSGAAAPLLSSLCICVVTSTMVTINKMMNM